MQTFLAEIPPYDTLDEAALQSLASIAVTRHYRKNHVIIYQGDDTNSMFILCQGEMRVYVEDENGRQLTVRMLKPGDSLGEVALIGDFPRTASVVTLTPCTVASFTRANYLAFLKKHPDLLLALAHLDDFIRMIRESKNRDEARSKLKAYDFSRATAESLGVLIRDQPSLQGDRYVTLKMGTGKAVE